LVQYDIFDDPYCYKNTFVLKNKAGIRDAEFELEMSILRAEEPLPEGKFTPLHYCKVHYHLFQDVYRWAGRYRTVHTTKGGNTFCYPEHIPNSMNRLFNATRGGPSVLTGIFAAAVLHSSRVECRRTGGVAGFHLWMPGERRAEENRVNHFASLPVTLHPVARIGSAWPGTS
jgi:hypothetical protein